MAKFPPEPLPDLDMLDCEGEPTPMDMAMDAACQRAYDDLTGGRRDEPGSSASSPPDPGLCRPIHPPPSPVSRKPLATMPEVTEEQAALIVDATREFVELYNPFEPREAANRLRDRLFRAGVMGALRRIP